MAYRKNTGPHIANLGSFDTFAELLANHPASTFAGGSMTAFCMDAGWVYTDGNNWLTMSASLLLYQIGVPVILPSSGSIGNNGALTLTTTLQGTIFPVAYLYFPAGAIFSGSAAGLYYTVMTSGTAGTIYNNVLTTGAPTVPASPTPFVTTGPGAYTQTAGSNLALLTLPIAGNLLGSNGMLSYEGAFIMLNNADAKSYSVTYGAATIQNAISGASLSYLSLRRNIRNRGVTNGQIFLSTSAAVSSDLTANASSLSVSAVDTTVSNNLVVSANIGTATDYWVLMGLNVSATYAL